MTVTALAVACLVGLVPTGCAREETVVSSRSTCAAATSHGGTTSGALAGADTDSMLAWAFAEQATDLQGDHEPGWIVHENRMYQ